MESCITFLHILQILHDPTAPAHAAKPSPKSSQNVQYTQPLLIPVRENRALLKEKYAMDCGWNWIFGDLETFLTFFFILGSKVNFPMDENRFSHNALTRRIDPRAPEGPWSFF